MGASDATSEKCSLFLHFGKEVIKTLIGQFDKN